MNTNGTTSEARAARARERREARRVDLFSYRIVKVKGKPQIRPNMAMRLLRWMIEHGTRTQAQMKAEQHRLGGAQSNIMHTVARYVRASGLYAPAARPGNGITVNDKHSMSVLVRSRVPTARSWLIVWVGSAGETYEERARNWVATLTVDELEKAFQDLESEMIRAVGVGDGRDERRAIEWLAFVCDERARRVTPFVAKRKPARAKRSASTDAAAERRLDRAVDRTNELRFRR